jgi:hypothetical protein
MSVVRQRFSPGNDSGMRPQLGKYRGAHTDATSRRKEHAPLLAGGYQRRGVDQDESRDGWSRGALILSGVGHAAHDNAVTLLHCDHLSAVERDIDLASAPW